MRRKRDKRIHVKMDQPGRSLRKDVFIDKADISGERKGQNVDSSSFKNIVKVKVVLVGDSGVGKTCLATRFVEGTYKSERTTSLAVTFLQKEVDLKDHTILFQIWDTAGQERYRSLVPVYLRGAKAALLVYDATNLSSFGDISDWLKQLHQNCPQDIKIVLVAAKCDLPSAVPAVAAEEFAKKNRMIFMETSSKTGFNVDNVFTKLASVLIIKEEDDIKNVLDLTNVHNTKKKQCCSS
ncbi:hypothetical protein ACJMK2_013422 [Sinanodonta woodiana]|uniref:Uncharacterized protein n=1 Tax=Sinanodonta woodiana TaxID=1069815 RepID=A0ABD3UXF6_SINWO